MEYIKVTYRGLVDNGLHEWLLVGAGFLVLEWISWAGATLIKRYMKKGEQHGN